jgi:hypothetical protein
VTCDAKLSNTGNTAMTVAKADVTLAVDDRSVTLSCPGTTGLSQLLMPGQEITCNSNGRLVTETFASMLEGSIAGVLSAAYTPSYNPSSKVTATDATEVIPVTVSTGQRT